MVMVFSGNPYPPHGCLLPRSRGAMRRGCCKLCGGVVKLGDKKVVKDKRETVCVGKGEVDCGCTIGSKLVVCVSMTQLRIN